MGHQPPSRGVVKPRNSFCAVEAGADLVQGYTAFLYEGPLWVRGINKDLARARARGRTLAKK